MPRQLSWEDALMSQMTTRKQLSPCPLAFAPPPSIPSSKQRTPCFPPSRQCPVCPLPACVGGGRSVPTIPITLCAVPCWPCSLPSLSFPPALPHTPAAVSAGLSISPCLVSSLTHILSCVILPQDGTQPSPQAESLFILSHQ